MATEISRARTISVPSLFASHMPVMSLPPPARFARRGPGHVGTRQQREDLADGAFAGGGLRQRDVRLDAVAVAAAVILVAHVPGLDQVSDDAERAAYGNAQAGRAVAQAHPGVM